MRLLSTHPAGTALAIAVTGIAAVAALAAPANAAETFDPVTVVQTQHLLGDTNQQTTSPKAAVPNMSLNSNSSARQLTASPIRPNMTALVTPAGVTASIAANKTFGFVTGANAQGTNATYVVIANEQAPSTFAFHISGTDTSDLQLTSNSDGSIAVRDVDGTFINTVRPAWATDANGKSLPTSYSIDGSTIAQHVDTRGAAFPVTADPSFGCGTGWCSLYFNKSETRDIATAGFTALGGAVAACAKGGPVAVAACAAAAAAIGATAQYAVNHNQCVGLSFWGIPPIIGWNPFAYNGTQCR